MMIDSLIAGFKSRGKFGWSRDVCGYMVVMSYNIDDYSHYVHALCCSS